MPRQGGISDKMNRFLAQYLPMLFQQQQREGYVDYSYKARMQQFLEEMSKREEMGISSTDRARVSTMLQNFFSTLGAETKELPYGSQQFAERSGATAREFGLPALPVDPELGSKTQQYAEVAMALTLAKRTGEELPPEIVQKSVELFGLDATLSEVAKFDTAMSKRIDQQYRGAEIGIKTYEAGTRRLTAETGATKEGREAGAAAQKQWIDFITDIETHLRAEGVEPAEGISDLRAMLAGGGKITDPLSPELRGQAYTYLGQIRAKLIQGEMPTAGEIRFLTAVRNSAKVLLPEAEGGGLPDPTKTQQEIEVDEAMLQAYIDAAREWTKDDVPPPTEEQIRALAMEFMRKKIK